ADVRDQLVDLLRGEIAGAYLAWAAANAQAVADEARGVSVEIAGVTFYQKPQRYAAKALAELKKKRASVEDEALAALLEETGCDAYLKAAATIASPEMAPDDGGDVGDDETDEGEDD
ncbi:MAG: hypothetical protein K2X34_06950, partial [Hyphomonadaceae bacterium]|nr:hypothetical protein [Hyphomonadaceae bacterium]